MYHQSVVEMELQQAAENGNETIVKVLLDNYKEIDLVLEYDEVEINTPLYYAIKNDHLPIVKLIIDQEPSRSNLPCQCIFRSRLKDVFYPLFIAATFGSTRSFLYLLDMGAYIEKFNGYNYKRRLKLKRTALCIAAQKKREEMVLILLKEGANPENLVEWSNCKFPIQSVTEFVQGRVRQIEEENNRKELKELERRRKMVSFTSLFDLRINMTNTF